MNPENPEISIKPEVTSLSANRPKREVKKKEQQDMVYSFTGLESELTATCTRPKAGSTIQLKYQKINDNQDPFVLMYKHVIEPIFAVDRLEVLFKEKL